MDHIKIMDFNNVVVLNQTIVNGQHGYNINSDQAFSVDVTTTSGLQCGYIVDWLYNNEENTEHQNYYYIIDKVLSNTKLSLKSVLLLLNQKIYNPTPTNLRDLLLTNFSNNLDLVLNLNMFDFSEVTTSHYIDVGICNPYEELKSACLQLRLYLRIECNEFGKIKIKTETQEPLFINLNDIIRNGVNDTQLFYDIEPLQIKRTYNTCNVITRTVDKDANFISLESEKYYLTIDNTLTQEKNDPLRVVPGTSCDVEREVRDTQTIAVAVDIAAKTLIDTSNYSTKFKCDIIHLPYPLTEFGVTRNLEIHYDDRYFVTPITSYQIKDNVLEINVGVNDINILSYIRKGGI